VDTCKEMVINGLGYGILSNRVLSGIGDLYKVNLTDQAGNPILRRTWMYYHKESLEWNVVRAFVQFIENFDWKNN
jgi:DNA-binding transcriptional LysR family regulator